MLRPKQSLSPTWSCSAPDRAGNPPDLAVSGVTVSPGAISGQTITVSYKETNLGGATPNGWFDTVYLSRNQVLGSSSDVYLGYINSTGLAAGASQTITQTFTVPDGQSGAFWVIVVADAGDALGSDPNRNNNVATSSEVQVSQPAVVDLNVGTISVPGSVMVGETATFTYTVNNLSTIAEQGSWYDALYLSSNGSWSPTDPLIGEVYHTGGIAGDGSYTGTLTAQLPGAVPGKYDVIVRTDVLSEVSRHQRNRRFHEPGFHKHADLVPGTAATGTLTTDQSVYYQLVVGAGETVNLALTSDNPTSIDNIYVRYGDLPTTGLFDNTSTNPAVADPTSVIPIPTWNLLCAGHRNSVAGSEDYSLTATALPFSISHITPDYGSNLGSVTLTIDGAQFNGDEQAEVIAPDGTIRDATEVDFVNSTEVWATFNLEGLAVGTYDVEIGDGTQTATLSQAFDVTNGPTGSVSVNLVLPQFIRAGQNGVLTVDYANLGDTDVAAPVLDLSSTQALIEQTVSSAGTSEIAFLGTSASGPAGILQPGAQGSVSFSYTPINPTPHEEIGFNLGTLATAIQNGTGSLSECCVRVGIIYDWFHYAFKCSAFWHL